MIHSTFIANLGADAEVRFSQSGTAVLRLRIATTYKTGQEEYTTWVGAALFGKRAEALGKLGLSKGDRVLVSGVLYTREHEGRTYVDLNVSEIELLGGKRNGDAPSAGYGRSGAGANAKHTAPPEREPKAPGFDDDLPF